MPVLCSLVFSSGLCIDSHFNIDGFYWSSTINVLIPPIILFFLVVSICVPWRTNKIFRGSVPWIGWFEKQTYFGQTLERQNIDFWQLLNEIEIFRDSHKLPTKLNDSRSSGYLSVRKISNSWSAPMILISIFHVVLIVVSLCSSTSILVSSPGSAVLPSESFPL